MKITYTFVNKFDSKEKKVFTVTIEDLEKLTWLLESQEFYPNDFRECITHGLIWEIENRVFEVL